MSAAKIDRLLNLWAASLLPYGGVPPFRNHEELYKTIDKTPLGDVPWSQVSVSYDGPLPSDQSQAPSWMTERYTVHFRDARAVVLELLKNPEFKDDIDFGPYEEYDENGDRILRDLMSAEWAWEKAVRLLIRLSSSVLTWNCAGISHRRG